VSNDDDGMALVEWQSTVIGKWPASDSRSKTTRHILVS